MSQFEYTPKGVCATKITFDVAGNIITNIKMNRGCSGNSTAIAELCKGRPVNEVIEKLHGIPCPGRGTSCPDQIAKGLMEYKDKNSL